LDYTRAKEKDDKGYVVLELNRKRSNWAFITNYIEMIGIPNAYEIERKCRYRLEGNPKKVNA